MYTVTYINTPFFQQFGSWYDCNYLNKRNFFLLLTLTHIHEGSTSQEIVLCVMWDFPPKRPFKCLNCCVHDIQINTNILFNKQLCHLVTRGSVQKIWQHLGTDIKTALKYFDRTFQLCLKDRNNIGKLCSRHILYNSAYLSGFVHLLQANHTTDTTLHGNQIFLLAFCTYRLHSETTI